MIAPVRNVLSRFRKPRIRMDPEIRNSKIWDDFLQKTLTERVNHFIKHYDKIMYAIELYLISRYPYDDEQSEVKLRTLLEPVLFDIENQCKDFRKSRIITPSWEEDEIKIPLKRKLPPGKTISKITKREGSEEPSTAKQHQEPPQVQVNAVQSESILDPPDHIPKKPILGELVYSFIREILKVLELTNHGSIPKDQQLDLFLNFFAALELNKSQCVLMLSLK